MFGGNTKKDLDEVVIMLSEAYDFIEAYTVSEQSNVNSIGYISARALAASIRHCFENLKSIDAHFININNEFNIANYIKKRGQCHDRKPNKYMAIFENPNILSTPDIEQALSKIDFTCHSAIHHCDHEIEAMTLIDQYCYNVKIKFKK